MDARQGGWVACLIWTKLQQIPKLDMIEEEAWRHENRRGGCWKCKG